MQLRLHMEAQLDELCPIMMSQHGEMPGDWYITNVVRELNILNPEVSKTFPFFGNPVKCHLLTRSAVGYC